MPNEEPRALETTLIDMAATDLRTRGIDFGDFDRIVREHQKQIYRILLLMMHDPDAADTLTQECFLRAFRKRDSFRGESSLSTWLARIAINLARDHNRSRRWAFWRGLRQTDPAVVTRAADVRDSPEQVLLAREQMVAVWSAVERLAGRQKEAFILRFAEEMPLEAIALAMNLEVGTVKAHLSRALQAVRKRCGRPTREPGLRGDRTGE